MMTLDEAIQHCKERAEEKRKDYERADAYNLPSDGCLKCAEEHDQLASWLEELKDRREADRWIPVSERLPEKEGDYLVDCKERHFAIEHFYFSIADRTPYWSGMRKVYAWRPLPERYKESEGET